MPERRASRTADGIAWLHAAHQIIDSAPRVLDDPVIARLMGATASRLADRSDRLQTSGARVLRAHAVVRTRFAEDRLEGAVARGVRQYVLLGAGMDTFAYRQPPWARALRVFEIDQPATQAIKRERVAASGILVPENVTYVAVDFEVESLADALHRGGVLLDQPTCFAWLGVTMYLTGAAIHAVLRTVTAFPPPSEIVFTFAQPPSADDVRAGPTLADRAAEVGEPWVTFFEPAALETQLRDIGFSRVEFLTPAETVSRYFQGHGDSLPAPRRTSIVAATV